MNTLMKSIRPLFFSFCSAGVLLFGLDAAAATLTVPGNFPTLQAAINGAPDGSEIVVAPGTYTEYLTALDL
ncbi:MAG: hypothetical protein ACO3N7_08720, partial [Kiritimatiellia bacterium]